MPLNTSRFAANLEKEMRRAMRKFGGKPGKPMKRFARGLSRGIIKTIKGKQGRISPTGGIARPGTGITGIKPNALTKEMLKTVRALLRVRNNPVQRALFEAISIALVKEMKQMTLIGGAAGNVTGFKGWSGSTMGKNIQKETGFNKTKEGNKLYKSLGMAITNAIQKKAKGVLPRAGEGSGSTTAIIS